MIDQYFNRIYVIESLPIGDRPTGTELYDDLLRWRSDQVPNLSVSFHSPKSKSEFFTLLQSIYDAIIKEDVMPILHLEMHGTEEMTGLCTATDDFISWDEIKPSLTQMNIALRNNLFVTLAACNGFYLARVLRPTDRSPVWGLLGPSVKLLPRDLVVNFFAFYTELLDSFDGDRALRKLNDSICDPNIKYGFTHCVSLFKTVFKHYHSTEYTEDARQRRAEGMLEKARGHPKWRDKSDEELIQYFKSELIDKRRYFFEKSRKTFFMHDLYPENRDRFWVDYDEVS